ncbi:MAG TPA: hypothetical protein VFM65_11085 [Flavobacteriaceae bacterium]|nr:hypothetical protein [Flavobacteriaceae bacterium]
MKKIVALLVILSLGIMKSFACEVCKRNQPEPLQGITHGSGPTGNIDYIITAVAVITVGLSLFLAIKFLVKPKEGQPDHIKNIVLDEN